MKGLKEYLIQNVNPEEYFKWLFPDWEPGKNIVCPFHGDMHPSLNINEDGKSHCFSPECNFSSTNIVTFHQKYFEVSMIKALKDIYIQFIEPVISNTLVKRYHKNLIKNQSILDFLRGKRNWSRKTIKIRKIGYDYEEKRIIIPIYNRFGFCVNLRKYKPGSSKYKMIGIEKSNKPRLWPEINLKRKVVYLFAGEPDTLCAESLGIHGVTVTGSEAVWKDEFTEQLINKDVIIILDNDKAGRAAGKLKVKQLRKHVNSLKLINLPVETGEDFTDYCVEYGYRKTEFLDLINSTEFVVEPKQDRKSTDKEIKPAGEYESITLSSASKAEFYLKPIKISALVTGKHQRPYLPPKRVRVICDKDEHLCEFCIEHESQNYEAEIPINSREIIRLVECSDEQRVATIKSIFGLPRSCSPKIEILEAFNIEKAQVIPKIDIKMAYENEYVKRTIYYVGHGLKCNVVYDMQGFLVPDKDQAVTYIITKAVPVDTLSGKHRLSSERIKQLMKLKRKPLSEILYYKYKYFSDHVTNVFGRPDLHLAMDLVFHSALSFRFNNEIVRRGWIDGLVIGDSRLGKGHVVKGMMEYYNLGTIISGENSTPVGIIGGLTPIGNQYVESWGALVNNTRGLLVIDELADLPPEYIGKMSRVRSDGTAEIDKGDVHAKTVCQTRLLCLSNCRSMKSIGDYSFGIESVRELYGHLEDMARCDFVLAVSKNEISPEVINQVRSELEPIENPFFSKELCRDLILWAWSLSPDEIKFTKKATEECLNGAMNIGKKYACDMPLIQIEDVRHKIARLAVSFAVLNFSTKDGIILDVTSRHIRIALKWLDRIYSKPAMGYAQYAKNWQSTNSIKDMSQIKKLFKFKDAKKLAENFLQVSDMTLEDIMTIFGESDRSVAQAIANELVSQRALYRRRGYFVKTQSFIKYLNSLVAKGK